MKKGLFVLVKTLVLIALFASFSPAFAASISGVVTLTAVADDNVGVVGVQFQLDSANLGAEILAFPFALSWNTATVSDGTHTLVAAARDAAGNQHASTMTITVDNTAPTVSLTAPGGGASITGTAVTLSATASDAVGVAGVQFKVDGVNIGAEDTSSPFSTIWDSTTISNGSHALTAVARDDAGNLTTSLVVNVTLNNPAPGPLGKTSPANGAIGQSRVPTLSWATGTNAISYDYCVDTTNNNQCDSSWTNTASTSVLISGLSPSTTYFWQVRARNNANIIEADSGVWWSFSTAFSSPLNVAAAANGGVATASSSVNAGYGPAGANNGDRKGLSWRNGGGWNDGTQDSFPDWLQIDFSGPQTIDEVDVFTIQDDFLNPVAPTPSMTFTLYGMTDFQVQYWNGSAWAVIPGGNVTSNNKVWRQFAFSGITTTQIRVYVTGGLASFSRIVEVEAYADVGVTPNAFAKTSVANGSTGQSLIPMLSWGTSNAATSYEFCVDTTNNNSCDTSWTSTTNTSAALARLNAGTTYWWQVRARIGGSTTEADGGVWWSFTTSVATVNVAAAASGAVASASSSVNAAYSPSGTINGDRKGLNWGSGGGWNDGTSGAFPDWLQVDFAGPQTINEIDVYTVQDAYSSPVEPFLGQTFSQWGITAFQFQYWDGLAWATVPGGNITGNNQVWRQTGFAPVTTPRIRIFITGALNAYSRITEVEAFADLSIAPGPFLKASPANTAVGQALSPTLTWGTSSAATSYEYCIDSINNNVCDTSWTTVAGASAVINGLSAGSTYYWQVRARNSVGVTDADIGAWWSFTTSFGGHVNVAAAVFGATASASSFINPGFASSGTIDGDRKGLAWSNGGGWNDSTAGAYPDWLQVDFAGPQTINEIDVFTVQDAYASPVDPTLGMTFSQYGITSFQVQYWDGSTWVNVPGGNISANSLVWRQLAFASVTTSRIRVNVTAALNSYSRIVEVEAYSDLSVVPGVFAKISPANGAGNQPLVPTLSWSPSSAATSYEYCVDSINNNSCDTNWTSTGSTSAVLNGYIAGTYYWQVRARNGTGTSVADTGSWWSFTTVVNAGANVAAAANGATASSSSSYNANFPASGVIDGDRKGLAWGSGGGWNDATANAFPDWLQIDFAGAKSIGEVDVFTVQDNFSAPVDPTLAMTFTQYGITNFQVQYWDGTSWVTVPNGNINGNTSIWQRITFPSLTTTKIRVNVTGALNSYSRIVEVEAY